MTDVPDISAMGRHALEICARSLLQDRAEATRIERLYSAAIGLWGAESQMRLVQEECAELIVAINHVLRGRIGIHALSTEVADVEIMCAQLRLLIGHGPVDAAKKAKLERLHGRVHGGPNV